MMTIPRIAVAAILAAAWAVPARAADEAQGAAPTKSIEVEEWSTWVTKVEGEATIYLVGSGEGEGIKAKADMPLNPGDRVFTGEDGTVEIAVKSDSVLELGPNSALALDAVEKSSMFFGLPLGRIVARVRLLMARRLEVRTPSAQAAVRGTEFAVEIVPEEEGEAYTVVGVFDEGKLLVTSAEDETGEDRVVEARQETEVRRGQPPGKARRMEFLLKREERIKYFRERAAALKRRYKKYSRAKRDRMRRKMQKRRDRIRKRREKMREGMERKRESSRERMQRLREEGRERMNKLKRGGGGPGGR